MKFGAIQSITQYQIDELERVQKQVMRIIVPGRTYDEALVIARCERLDIKRKKICINTFLHKALLRNMCYKLEKPSTTIVSEIHWIYAIFLMFLIQTDTV